MGWVISESSVFFLNRTRLNLSGSLELELEVNPVEGSLPVGATISFTTEHAGGRVLYGILHQLAVAVMKVLVIASHFSV